MDELVVIGMGHIGGSVAAAATAQSLFARVVGVETDPAHRQRAKALGLAEAVGDTLAGAPNAGLVVVAVPPSVTAEVVAGALASCPRAVVTDTAGVKAPVLARVRELAPDRAARFVGSHPMAGTAGQGPDTADPKLFEGRTVVVAVDARTDLKAVAAVEALWRALGATTVREEPAVHDRAIALLSHVPHAVAFALVAAAAGEAGGYVRAARLAGPSWESATRVAASDPALWTELFCANRAPLLEALAGFRQALLELETDLAAAGDPARLRERLTRIRASKHPPGEDRGRGGRTDGRPA